MSRKNIKKWMILGLLAQLFKSVEIEIFLKWFGPILGSKWTYFWSKIGTFRPKCTKKGKLSGKNIKKWMKLGLLAQLFETRSPGPTFRARQDTIVMVWTYFRVQKDLFWVQNRHIVTKMH